MSDPVLICVTICATIIILGLIGRGKKGDRNHDDYGDY